MSAPPHEMPTDVRLRAELEPVARRLRARRLHGIAAAVWIGVAAASLGTIGLGAIFEIPAAGVQAILAAFVLGAAAGLLLARRRARRDDRSAARRVEAAFPDLDQALGTALEQQPGDSGRYAFLQERVIRQALQHAWTHDWEKASPGRARWPALGHAAAFAAAAAVIALTFRMPRDAAGAIVFRPESKVVVTPGDAEVERGSVVVVSARFEGEPPRGAFLAWSPPGGGRQRLPMARSFSDPVFAVTLPAVTRDVTYRVEHDGRETRDFLLSVYERPALVRADAVLDYPDYTGLETKRVEDTRRVSAVQGTAVEYAFLFNKPVRRAVLREAGGGGAELALEPANPERTRFSTRIDLERSVRYALHLEDDAARANAWPDDIRLEAIPNRPPELRIHFPRGDQSVSALEEIELEGAAGDDFGLLDYGLGFAVGAGEPRLLSLRKESDAREFNADFATQLALEPHGVAPGDLVAWFAWARDHGPSGEERVTNSDLFFGEVRPFDEVFREQPDAPQQGQQGGQGGQAQDRLIETQRQISIALWKLRQEDGPGETFVEDVRMLADAQSGARRQLDAIRPRLTDDGLRQAADEAARRMDDTLEALEGAARARSPDRLGAAWQGSQGAYQALLRMQPRENRVAQARGAQSGQGGNNRNQRQLNQLRFRSSDDAYERESEAQALTSPEEREQLETLSRLRELARRQQDLNQRVQELQTALAAARDEEEREDIRRKLERLEEEQRRMLADLDEVRQRLDRRSRDAQAREARDRLERTREDMRRAGEALREGSVSEALASGTRAREDLDRVRDDLRRESSSRFAEDLREARREARELAGEQEGVSQAMDQLELGQRQLDNSEAWNRLADRLEENRERLGSLLENLRRVTEDADGVEPGLHRQLYDLLREQGQGVTQDRLENASELLRRGFVTQSRELQPGIGAEIDRLRKGIERAADSVLGDEASALRFAQGELDDLARALERERAEAGGEPAAGERPENADRGSGGRPGEPGREPGERLASNAPGEAPDGERSEDRASPGQGSRGSQPREGGPPSARGGRPGSGDLSELTEALEAVAGGGGGGGGGNRAWTGPITGGDFREWSDRLRTVESLLELPGAQERLAGARERAEELRQDFRRHGERPRWGLVEEGIMAPLSEVRTWLRQELARREDPAALQPVDRDPVPEGYAEVVKRYYESLGR